MMNKESNSPNTKSKFCVEGSLYVLRKKYSEKKEKHLGDALLSCLILAVFSAIATLYKFVYLDWISWIVYISMIVLFCLNLYKAHKLQEAIDAVDEWYMKELFDFNKKMGIVK